MTTTPPSLRPAGTAAPADPAPFGPPRAVGALDGAVDGGVVALALWTLWYEVALVEQLGLWLPAAAWLGVAVVCVAAGAVLGFRRGAGSVPGPGPEELASQSPWSRHVRPAAGGRSAGQALLVLATVLLVAAVAARESLGVLPLAVVGLGILGAQLLAYVRPRAARPDDVPASLPAEVPAHAHWVALAVSLGLAVLASLLLHPNDDDIYYVNRSTWVAAHGFAALRDTMFGPETFPSTYGGGLPVSSFEPLIGALAHVAHLSAGAVCYLLVPPLGGFLAGWVTWRLVRAWAPRGALLVFLLAVGLTLMSAHTLLGGYSLGRMWQGKVVAYCVLIPLIWCYLSVLVERRSRLALLMLGAAGVSYVGLTSSAALMAPVIGAAALLAALVLRSGRLALGALVLMVGPVLSGVAIALWPAAVGGIDPTAGSPEVAFGKVMGSATLMVCVSVLGIVLGVRRARGRLAVLAAAGSVAMLVPLLPGVLDLANAATGAGPVAWRLLIGVPVGVAVALLAAPPSPVADRVADRVADPAPGLVAGRIPDRWRPRLHAVLVAGAAALVLVGGTPIWSPQFGARLTSSPTWKVRQDALADVRAVHALRTRPGPWLLPPKRMSVLTIAFAHPAAVVPRDFYLVGVKESRADQTARRLLFRVAANDRPRPAPSSTKRALQRLDVSLVCSLTRWKGGTHYVDKITPGRLQVAGGLTCGRPAR